MCSKKHPRHCRYFWGFNDCRNKEACKFQHSKAPNNTDVKKIDALDQKYNELLGQLNHYKSLCENYDDAIATMKVQLEQQELEIHVLRSYVLPDSSQNESDFDQSVNVTTHDDDQNKETLMIIEDSADPHKDINDMEQEMDDDNLKTSKLLQKHELQTNILNIEYLEREIIKIKDFVASDEVRINKGINETRQKLKSLNNEMKSKFGKTGSEKALKNMLESLSEKVMKIKTNFKKNVSSELEKCAEICRKEKVSIEKKALLTAGR